MFSPRLNNYLIFFATAVVIGYVASLFKSDYRSSDDYALIKKYILNESPLYGQNRPKIWIHSKYEVNARKWQDFNSRNSTDLNQPYIHLAIKTIINHCSNDFNICLIDDETFSKIIPSWNVDLKNVAEPFKSHYREVGLMQLIYHYGGMVVPNSFICLKNLKDFYAEGIAGNKPFVCENICRNVNQFEQKRKMLFCPDTYFMGGKKSDITLGELIEYLKLKNQNPHFSAESDFSGRSSNWCTKSIELDQMNLVLGQKIGIKTDKRKTILIEDLMEEDYLDLSKDCVGIYIPAEEILNRPKYQWFAVLSEDELMNSRLIIAKYLKASILDSTDEYKKSTEIRSVVSI